MKPICLIPARGGSKGIHHKNIKMLGDKPLIAHTIEIALSLKKFEHVIVSTDDERIARISEKYGAEIPYLRPKNLATDHSSMDEVMLHDLKKLNSLGYKFDSVVLRDCTVPFISKYDIIGTLRKLEKNNCDLVIAVYRQHHNPYFNMMEPNKNGFLEFSKIKKKRITSRQSAPIVYQVNGLFAFDVTSFWKYRKIYMPKILAYEISPERGFMIDTKFEFQIADLMMKGKINFDSPC